MAFPTNANQVQAFAGAMYGIQIGSVTMAQVNSDIAAVGSLTGALNAYYAYSFGTKTTASVAATVAANLGLTGDALTQGVAYITAQLNAAAPGARGAVIANILSLFAGMSSDATFGAAATAWNTKVDAAAAYTAAADVAIGTVVATSSVFTLTTGSDVFTGTSAADTFNAANAAGTAAAQTFNNGDVLNGGAGTDTLNVSVGAASTYSMSGVSNIETVVGSFSAAGTLSLLGSSGITSISSNASTAAAIYSNIASTSVALASTNTDQNATFTFATAAVSGTADTATLTLSNQTAGTITVAGIETLNVVSTGGANALTTLTAANATTINISGDTTLNLGTNNTVATTIASTNTAGVTLTSNNTAAVTISGGAGNDAITMTEGAALSNNVNGGAGNDTITFTANLDTGDTVAGGDGTDTLVALSADLAAVTYTNVSGFENITVSDALAGVLTTATVQAGINRVNFAAAVASQTVTFEAGAKTISLNLLSAGTAETLTVGDTGTATTDSLTLLNGTTASDVFAGNDILAISGFETVTVNTSTTTAAGAAVALGAIGLTPDTGGSQVLNFVGNNSVVTGIITATGATTATVDASGLTGSRTFSNTGAPTVGVTSIIGSANSDILVGSATSTTISGGAGNDTITGGAGNDNIAGGDGNDAITAAAGNDVINGGAGNDTLTLGDNLTQNDVIDGGDGTDVLSITQATITAVNALSFGNGATLNSNLSNIERLTVTDAVTSGVDLARLDNISYITLNAGGGGQTFAGMAANSTVVIGDTTGGVFTLSDATGTADVLNVITTDLDGLASDETFTLVSATGIETVNITTREETASASIRLHTITTLTAASATAVNISGTESLTVTNATALKNVDASALTNILTLSVANAASAATVIGGAGADAITGSANGDTLTMGAGADSVNGAAGNDTIDGGSGSDTALYGGAGNDSITGGEGSDSIAGGAGNDAIILTETTAVTDTVYIGSTDTGGTDLAIGATNLDTITGFTAGASGDLMVFDIGTVVVTNGTQKVATLSADGATLTSLANTAVAGDVDIVIVLGEYGSYAAVQAALNSTAGTITDATNGAIVIWRDGAGATQVYFDTDISAGAGTGTQMATLVGVNTASLVAANFDVTAA